VGAGLVQINVIVPALNNGDASVVLNVEGVSTQITGDMIPLHN
jgi:uncharacterized protein (TIGR03437 family)